MYHILPPQRQRQYGSFGWNRQRFPRAFAHAEGLVELARAVLARIGGVQKQLHLALARGDLDLLGAGEEGAGARFQPQPVERCLAQGGLGALGEIVGSAKIAGLERAGERTLQLPVRLSLFQRVAIDADPGPAAGRLGADVGENLTVGPEGQANEILTRIMLP